MFSSDRVNIDTLSLEEKALLDKVESESQLAAYFTIFNKMSDESKKNLLEFLQYTILNDKDKITAESKLII